MELFYYNIKNIVYVNRCLMNLCVIYLRWFERINVVIVKWILKCIFTNFLKENWGKFI